MFIGVHHKHNKNAFQGGYGGYGCMAQKSPNLPTRSRALANGAREHTEPPKAGAWGYGRCAAMSRSAMHMSKQATRAAASLNRAGVFGGRFWAVAVASGQKRPGPSAQCTDHNSRRHAGV